MQSMFIQSKNICLDKERLPDLLSLSVLNLVFSNSQSYIKSLIQCEGVSSLHFSQISLLWNIHSLTSKCKVENKINFCICITRDSYQDIVWPTSLFVIWSRWKIALCIHVFLCISYPSVSISTGRKKKIKKWQIFWSPNSQEIWRRKVFKHKESCKVKVSTRNSKVLAEKNVCLCSSLCFFLLYT